MAFKSLKTHNPFTTYHTSYPTGEVIRLTPIQPDCKTGQQNMHSRIFCTSKPCSHGAKFRRFLWQNRRQANQIARILLEGSLIGPTSANKNGTHQQMFYKCFTNGWLSARKICSLKSCPYDRFMRKILWSQFFHENFAFSGRKGDTQIPMRGLCCEVFFSINRLRMVDRVGCKSCVCFVYFQLW